MTFDARKVFEDLQPGTFVRLNGEDWIDHQDVLVFRCRVEDQAVDTVRAVDSEFQEVTLYFEEAYGDEVDDAIWASFDMLADSDLVTSVEVINI